LKLCIESVGQLTYRSYAILHFNVEYDTFFYLSCDSFIKIANNNPHNLLTNIFTYYPFII